MTKAAHDFDFNHGDWVVTNRRLKERNAGCQEWEEFTSFETAQLMMGGMVSVDESDFPPPKASRACRFGSTIQ